MEKPNHPSMRVAPLHIIKGNPRSRGRTAQDPPVSLTRHERTGATHSSGQMTPPLTPHDTQKDMLMPKNDCGRSDFHTYLRAFYPYHPTCDESTSTVTLPMNSGDIILVHSVHTNGWADGTLLVSGARGWLPTNYCEPYDSESIRILLKALTCFWDLVKGSTHGGIEVFGRQDYVRGLVAGVRYLLVIITAVSLGQAISLFQLSGTDTLVGENKVPRSRIVNRAIA